MLLSTSVPTLASLHWSHLLLATIHQSIIALNRSRRSGRSLKTRFRGSLPLALTRSKSFLSAWARRMLPSSSRTLTSPPFPPLFFFISLCLCLSPHYLRVLVGSRTMMGVSATSLIITMGTAPPPLPSFESVASYICQPLCIHFLYIYFKKNPFINALFFFLLFLWGCNDGRDTTMTSSGTTHNHRTCLDTRRRLPLTKPPCSPGSTLCRRTTILTAQSTTRR